MYEEAFRNKLAALRKRKGVSAREMSLTLGQSESYINRIEKGKMLPSMALFFKYNTEDKNKISYADGKFFVG